MTIGRIPVTGNKVTVSNIFDAFFRKRGAAADFETALKKYLGSNNIFLANCGLTAFYLLFEALKELSPDRDEVILPAYTAGSVVAAVRKAGLRPVLVDISLEDFNMDISQLDSVVSKKTLCIVVIHMFGIPIPGTLSLKNKFRDVFIMEDCAQSMGSEINGKITGNFSDCGFFSFNRGKNLPTYGGGAAVTNRQDIADIVKTKKRLLNKNKALFGPSIALKILLFALAVRPPVYGALYHIISLFEMNTVPKGFELNEYSSPQAAMGLSLLKGFEARADARYNKGIYIIDRLKKVKSIITPSISRIVKPAFNRLPIVFKEAGLRDKVKSALHGAGIESSHMYQRPLHHMFDLGYKREAFQKAVYLAERLLTLPCHQLLDESSLQKMVKVIGENAK